MQIDREALSKIQNLNDRQLKLLIQRLAAESGIDLASFNIDPKSVESIRQALRTASDEDLKRIAEQYEANRNQKRR